MARKVLVVDDEPLFRGLMCELLRGMGYRVLEASDGEEAVRVFGQERPGVVFLDIQMPRKGGLEALQEIKALQPETLVVVITASPKTSDREVAEAAGVFEYLSKPVSLKSMEELIERIEAARG